MPTRTTLLPPSSQSRAADTARSAHVGSSGAGSAAGADTAAGCGAMVGAGEMTGGGTSVVAEARSGNGAAAACSGASGTDGAVANDCPFSSAICRRSSATSCSSRATRSVTGSTPGWCPHQAARRRPGAPTANWRAGPGAE